MEKRDTGRIRKIGESWYVLPDNLPFHKIELHPQDAKSFRNGNCLVPTKGLKVVFELTSVKRRVKRIVNGKIETEKMETYALIMQ